MIDMTPMWAPMRGLKWMVDAIAAWIAPVFDDGWGL